MHNMSKINPSTPMTHTTYEENLRSVERSSMHLCPENWVALGRPVVHYARDAHTLSAEIKCQQFILYATKPSTLDVKTWLWLSI